MKNLKIKYKIFSIMAALLLLVALASGLQIIQMSEINDQSSLIADSWLPSVEGSGNMNTILSDYRVSEYSQVASQNDATRVKYDELRSKLKTQMEEEMKTYKNEVDSDQERALFEAFEKKWQDYLALSDRVGQHFESGQKAEAEALLNGESEAKYTDTSAAIDALLKYNTDGGKAESDEADAMYAENKLIAMGLGAFIFLIGIVAGIMLIKNVATPITGITKYMGVLSSGDLTKDVPDRERKDEIGDMAMAIQTFKDNMVRAKALEAEQHKEELAKQERQKKVDAAIKKFELSMSDIVRFVASASTELQASAQSLSASAEETSKQSGAVAAASQQAAANVQTVASATEELSSSINEIASQVSRSSQVAARAVDDAEIAGKSVSELVDAAQKIGDITKIISAISEQTNLLALNATIEAARAGDAGKGFAVVASEVKNLANESTKATEEISSQIAHIQQITQTSAEAIDTICRIIREMDQISGTISAAIQEQTSATQEISRNVTEAYTGTSEVTQNIGSVSDAANSTGSASHQVLSAADELSRQSEILKEEFDVFVRNLAAA